MFDEYLEGMYGYDTIKKMLTNIDFFFLSWSTFSNMPYSKFDRV